MDFQQPIPSRVDGSCSFAFLVQVGLDVAFILVDIKHFGIHLPVGDVRSFFRERLLNFHLFDSMN